MSGRSQPYKSHGTSHTKETCSNFCTGSEPSSRAVYIRVGRPQSTMPGNGFNYHPRTRLIFGEGVIETLGELIKEFGGKRVLLVTDSGVAKAGHAARAEQSIAKAGIGVLLFDKVHENPGTKQVADCVAAARTQDIDF